MKMHFVEIAKNTDFESSHVKFIASEHIVKIQGDESHTKATKTYQFHLTDGTIQNMILHFHEFELTTDEGLKEYAMERKKLPNSANYPE